MKPRIYLKTTIPSYLTAWPSRDLVRGAHQQITREWWDRRRGDFDLFISQFVLDEAGAGDPSAAQRRLEAMNDLQLLDASEEVELLAGELVIRVPLPTRATTDALHIAIAAINGMDYLLTWNCTHIANAELRSRIELVIRERGYEPPIICTSEELIEESHGH